MSQAFRAAPLPAPVPTHLRLARTLAAAITPERNRYGSPAKIVWSKPVAVTAKCASFVTQCLKKAHPTLDFETWMQSTSPNSARYQEAVATGDGFLVLETVAGIRAGDVFAMRYENGSASGHTALVDGPPTLRTPTKPLIKGTTQYDLPVLDVTSSPHGTADSRVSGDSEDEGVGRGIMRLYVDAANKLVGYTWSQRSSSYHARSDRPFAFGRVLA